jgi:regulator of sigma E protease
MLESLFTFWNVLLMVLGFGFIIFVHEAGHFLAARWAGIRVHAFAIGFGQALISYRKGAGVQKGSSEADYMRLLAIVKHADRAGASAEDIEAGHAAANELKALSPTEYRLNWIPFGGYVKMLGQEDLNPDAASAEPDSYQSKPVWKRMVVISAGVIMNVILAAVLFVIVFKAGMTEPAPVIGSVQSGSPAEAVGLQPGDVVRSAGGNTTTTFTDLFVEVAMSKRGRSIELVVDRPVEGGGWQRITASPRPEKLDDGLGVQAIGVWPDSGLRLLDESRRTSVNNSNRLALERMGLGEVPFGSRMVEIDGEPVVRRSLEREGIPGTGEYASVRLLELAIDASGGEPVPVVFESLEGERVRAELPVRPSLMSGQAAVDSTRDGKPVVRPQSHLLGLTPVMRVLTSNDAAIDQNLLPGDVFKRIGSTSWPSTTDGVREIRSRKGETIEAVVLRDGEEIELTLRVQIDGTVGFSPDHDLSTVRLAGVPNLVEEVKSEDRKNSSFRPARTPPAAARLGSLSKIRPGTTIESVDGREVSDFESLRGTLQKRTAEQAQRGEGAVIALTLRTPSDSGASIQETVELDLLAEEVEALHELGWEVADIRSAFDNVSVLVIADSIGGAVSMGVYRTKRVLQQTYLTFQRLFEGSVEVNQLQGPVGITHTGSMFAERGFIYLLYFMALISANLAVINFLPLPIVDGGQFLMLCYEGLAKKPVPIIVQNVITLGGLLFIGGLFLYITFNDIVRLFGN